MGRAKKGESSRSKNKQLASSSQAQVPPRPLTPPRPRVFFRRWTDDDKFYLEHMKQVKVPGTKLAASVMCKNMSFDEDMDTLFTRMGLGQLWRLEEPTYPELVREFLASVRVSYKDVANPLASEGAFSFLIHKTYYEIPLNDLCAIFGFSAGKRTTLPWESTLESFWRVIAMYADKSRQCKEALVRNLVLRYSARLLGTMMFGTTIAASLSHTEIASPCSTTEAGGQ